VRIAALIEAQKSTYIAGKPDARAFANRTGRLRGCAQPQRARGTQVHPVLPEIDLHRSGQSAWASANVRNARFSTGASHALDPLKRFDGAQQHSTANP
jgi:hypothetical protein